MQAKHIALIVVALIIGIAIGYTPTAIAPKPTTTTITLYTPTYLTYISTLYTTVISVSPSTITLVASTTLPTTITTAIPTTIVSTSQAVVTKVETKVLETTVQLAWPRKIVDALGREILFDSPPKRVVSTMPSITEELFALGLGDRVVGVDSYSNYPPEVLKLVNQSKIADVGDPWSLNLEKIISLKPDVVFMCRGVTYHETEFREKLEEAGVKTFFLKCDSARDQYDIYADLITLGQIFDVEAKAKELAASIQDRIDAITAKLVNVSKPRVLQLVGPLSWGLWSAGGDTFIGWLINVAGGDNIAAVYRGWPQLSYEYIISKDPQIIIITAHDVDPQSIYKTVVQSPLVNTTAWRNGRVYLVVGDADDILSRPGPRIAEALDILAKIIHPEIFGEIQRADVINIATMKFDVLVPSSERLIEVLVEAA